MSEKCPRCFAHGYVGHLKHTNRWYRILCPRCHGKKHLDWIERALPPIKSNFMKGKPGFDTFTLIQNIHSYLHPNNYVFVFGGTTYFMDKEFFSIDDIRQKWSRLRMNVPFLKNNPGTLDMWRD